MDVINNISLSKKGKNFLIFKTKLLENIIKIYDYNDDIDCDDSVAKYFSWSIDDKVWSYWTSLNINDLSVITDYISNGFFIRFKYVSSSDINVKDINLLVDYRDIDVNKVIRQSISMSNQYIFFNDSGVEDYDILNPIDFDLYNIKSSIKLYNQILKGVNDFIGVNAIYLKASPSKDSADFILKEWTLYSVENASCLKIIMPDNQLPVNDFNYDFLGMEYVKEFEVHIIKNVFESVFGKNTAPQEYDIVYIPLIKDRLYEVSSSQLVYDFMGEEPYWKVNLVKYNNRTNVDKQSNLDSILNAITKSSKDLFENNVINDIKDITKDQEFNRYLGNVINPDDNINNIENRALDPIKIFVDKNLQIIDYQFKNNNIIISEHQYNLYNSKLLGKIAIKYNIMSSSLGDNFSYSSWFKLLDNKKYVDDVIIKNKNDNNIGINILAIRNYNINDLLYFERANNYFIGTINEKIDNNNFNIDILYGDIDNLYSKGWKVSLANENILIDGYKDKKGLQISIIENRIIKIVVNDKIYYFKLRDKLVNNIWYTILISYSNIFRQINCTIYKIKDIYNDGTLAIIFNETKNNIEKEVIDDGDYFKIFYSNIVMTNIRIYNEIINFDTQDLLLSRKSIDDFSKIILFDMCDPKIFAFEGLVK